LQSKGGVWPIADIFRQWKGGSDADNGYPNTRIYGVSAWKKGMRRVESVRTKVEFQ